MTPRKLIRAAAGAVIALAAGVAQSQTSDIAAAVRNAPDGTVRLTYASRSDVCGNGNSISFSDEPGSTSGRWSSPDVEWSTGCERGPVHLVLAVANHTVTRIRAYVGGQWRPADHVTDIGMVSPGAAVAYLLSVARTGTPSASKSAIFPTTLADGVTVWPELISIARDERVGRDTRRDAVFWLGQAAGKVATAHLAALAAEDTLDRDIREQAVFALSQRPRDEAVPELIRIAQTNRDPAVRKRAMFWLGQTNDPRAVALFEQILTK